MSLITCGPDEALVKAGCMVDHVNIVRGGFVFAWPFCQSVQRLDLTIMTLHIHSAVVYTKVGVPITVSSIAQVRVSREEQSLKLAASNFLGMGREEIEKIATMTMEGHQRAIMGTLTVEEIYQDRKKFAIGVREVAGVDIARLGLEIVSYTIKDVKDDEGYLEALGRKRTAEVKKDARIGEAEAFRDAGIREAEARKQQMASKFFADTQIADADRKYLLQKAAYDREVNAEKAKANLAGELQQAKTMQEIKKEQMEIDVIERRKQIEIEEQEIMRKSKELEATVKRPAEAIKFKTETLAEGERQQAIKAAEAESESIRAKGLAEASVIQAKGEAEAERMAKMAEAWKEYSQGAYLEMVIKKLPEITSQLAKPLAAADNVVIVGQSGNGVNTSGADRMTKEVTSMIAQLPPVVQSLTGIDLIDLVKKLGK
jgi:flotillin